MRRQYKKPRAKKVKLPRAVPPPKPERPKRGDLKKIYRDLITTDINQRINALASAMTWYDRVQGYLASKNQGKWTTNQLRYRNIAEKDRALGIRMVSPKNKEEDFIEAIKSYEKLVNGYKPPKLAPVLRKLKSSKSTLTEHKHNMQKKFGKFLTQLQEALNPGVKLIVDKLSSPYRIGERTLTLDRKLLAHLKKLTHKYGLLSAVIQLLPVLSETMSTIEVKDYKGQRVGRSAIDSGERYRSVLTLINNLNNYSQRPEAPKSIARRRKPPNPQC